MSFVPAIDHLRRYAVARSLFPPTTPRAALERLGFLQADPIRAPARAQDLTLRHRVADYRAGDLERQYARLPIEEDVFVNYGYVSRAVFALMHPRTVPASWSSASLRKAPAVLEFVRSSGTVHPRDVDAHFSHGTVTNYWGGSSNATTHLLDALHYRGLLRIVGRERGIRLYAVRERAPEPPSGAAERRARLDALVDVAVQKYGPLPGASLRMLVARLRYAAPQWRHLLKGALERARQRLGHARIDGVDWYWPAGDDLQIAPGESVCLLGPFDPVVWDRRRFELFWGWAYRFEAYTPAAKRVRGYYALPLLWRDRVIGWSNVSIVDGSLQCELGYVGTPPRDRPYRRELDAEVERMRAFLGFAAEPPMAAG